MMTIEQFWQQVLADIRQSLTVKDYNEWFVPVQVLQRSAHTLTLRVPDLFFSEYFQREYGELLRRVIRQHAGSDLSLVFVVESTPLQPQLPLDGLNVTPSSKPLAEPPRELFDIYTFETFVVGPSNQFSHATCIAVADKPGSCYNPLFIYGGVGLGKTHLLHAIGHRIYQRDQTLRVKYVSSESFLNEMIYCTRTNQLHEFRNRYRTQCDVLLIDDIQFIAGKDRTQEEFFHTFNALYGAGRQIVLTSDQTPQEMAALEDRLRSRFQWGLIADIAPPEIETRIAILKSKAIHAGVDLPDDVAMLIANRVRTNVRNLEGTLNRLQAYARLHGIAISLAMAKEVLRDFFPDQGLFLTVEAIQKAVASHFNVRTADLTGSRRHRAVALPRQVAMYLCRRLTHQSFPAIGQGFGGRDHSTVITAVRTIESRIQQDATLRQTIERLERTLDA